MRVAQVSLLFLLLSSQVAAQNLQPIKILVNGVELHYVEKGQGEPIIFLHGGSGDYRSWEGLYLRFLLLCVHLRLSVAQLSRCR